MTGTGHQAAVRLSGSRLPATVAILGPLVALLAVWMPVLIHYYVPTPVIDEPVVVRLRVTPDDAVLAQLDGMRFGTVAPDGSGAGAAADEILQGTYRTRTGETIPVVLQPVSVPTAGSPMAQLQISSLAASQVLLDAYAASGDERYFEAALRSVVAWARIERRSWLPQGFLWNDHAVAARVVVLTNLWRAYRHRPDFDPATGREILQFVARSAALLARDSHYTARTNHGIMQNLALLHVAAAFPGLPGTAGDVDLAIARLERQLQYYVSPGGVVLEHSAGYQDFAIKLLRYAVDYAGMLHLPDPALRKSLAAAECFRRQLTRPDGSMPAFGDTFSPAPVGPDEAGSAGDSCPPGASSWVDQEFGYGALGSPGDPPGQLLVTWADFDGRAHKHDDDLAAWLWLDGRDWWAGSGYWPYGDPDRKIAVSWRGANAPHAVGERGNLPRENRLLGYRSDAPLPFLDLERRTGDGHTYRRQLASLGAAGIMVLDSASGGGDGDAFETVWTLMPGIGVRAIEAAPAAFEVIDVASGRTLHATFSGGDGFSLERLRGSRQPFGGLVALQGEIRPAEALIAVAPTGTWSGALWRIAGAEGPSHGTGWSVHWNDPEAWSAAMPAGDPVITVSRQGRQLALHGPAGEVRGLAITDGPATRPALAAATAQYREASVRYPVFQDYFKWRLRATIGIGGLFACQLLALWMLPRVGLSRRRSAALLTVMWVTATGWLYYQYLV